VKSRSKQLRGAKHSGGASNRARPRTVHFPFQFLLAIAFGVCGCSSFARAGLLQGDPTTPAGTQGHSREREPEPAKKTPRKLSAQRLEPAFSVEWPSIQMHDRFFDGLALTPQGQLQSTSSPRQSPGAALPLVSNRNTGPITLSFKEAVQLALERNPSANLARERIREARGRAEQARAGLLPNLSGTAMQVDQTTNIAALGFEPGTFPGITHPLIGPFRLFDARIRLVQSLFSLSAIRQAESGSADVRISELNEHLARQQVTTQTAIAYLNVLTTARAVEAAEANVNLAESLLTLARNQHDAGVATGVDVTRAQTRVSQEQVRLAQAQTSSQQARLELLRLTGLPLGDVLSVSDSLGFNAQPLLNTEQTVSEAERERLEVLIAAEQVRLNSLTRQSVEAERLPSIDLIGDYGESGNTPTINALPTRSFGVRVNVPIFNGGLTEGRIGVAASRQRQAEIQLADVRAQVEQDVRNAVEALMTATEQVRAATQAVQLADRELTMSRDRFAAGVADNIEVITAQTALANARSDEVNALAAYNAARINLAAARGRVESFAW